MMRTGLIGFVLALALPLSPQSKQFDITPGSGWLDTGIDVNPGDSLHITATGQLQYSNARQTNGPAGLPRAFTDVLRALAVNDAGRGALVGRIGSSDAARPFLVGELLNYRAPIAGHLFLAINESAFDQATGSFHVVVQLTAAKAARTQAPVKVPAFPQSLLDSIPRRVVDAQGNPGDRVNFVLIGSQDQVQAAFKAAGWVVVDKTDKDAILTGLLDSLSKEAYVAMPMSVLYLYGRPQDFGYAQADPLRVVASRHHLRLWKVPETLDGQTVWAGAGMHDIGFARDDRNNGITHKIDPDSDHEREYIRDSLLQTGMAVKTDYMTPANPVLTAKTATGSGYTSDGRTLLVYLSAATGDVSQAFGDTFCSVLKQENPDTGSWGPCSQYIDAPGKDDLKLGPLSARYRVLIVPGFMSSCLPDTPAFQEGLLALKKEGLDVAVMTIPNDSSESNAKVIAQYLRDHKSKDGKKFILVGYSKGGPDVQVALAEEPGVKDQVAAFITVAGASGGSPVADLLPSVADKYMKTTPIKSCQGDLSSGYKSLQRANRKAFLSAYPNPVAPTYSLIASSDQTNTSKALLETWRILQSYGPVEDGQLLRDDAIVPGAKFLGAAHADHFAVALPFDKSTDATIRAEIDKATYPRAALLESLVRFVTADLAQTSQ